MHILKKLLILSLTASCAFAEDFPLVNDDFDNGDPATNNEGGYILRGVTSMDAAEANGALTFGPAKNWA